MTKEKWPNGVKAALDHSGIGQSDLARQIGESRQQVSRWVKGERKLTFAMAMKMSSVLGATPEALFVPPGMTEIIKAGDLAGHKSASEKEREIRQEIFARMRNLSAEALSEVVAEAVSELQNRAEGSDQLDGKTTSTRPASSPRRDA